MRIAIFTEYIHKDGGGSQLTTLHYAQGLRNLKHDTQIFYVKNPYADKLLTKLDIEHTSLNPFITPLMTLDFLGALKSLKEFKPELIVVNEVFTTFIIGLLCARILNVPIVACFHTFYFKNSETSLAWFNELLKILNILYIKPWFSLVDDVTVASEFSKKFLLDDVDLSTQKIRITPHPVFENNDIGALAKKAPIDANNIKFLYAGRLVKGKNVDLIIEAFANLKSQNWSLTIIGSGKEQQNIKKLIYKLGLKSKVTLKPFMPREELLKSFANYDVFISLSDMETFGLTYFEPLVYGLKLVCLEYETTQEFFKHFDSVFLLKSKNPKTLAQQIDNLFESNSLTKSSIIDLEFLKDYTYTHAAQKLIEPYDNSGA